MPTWSSGKSSPTPVFINWWSLLEIPSSIGCKLESPLWNEHRILMILYWHPPQLLILLIWIVSVIWIGHFVKMATQLLGINLWWEQYFICYRPGKLIKLNRIHVNSYNWGVLLTILPFPIFFSPEKSYSFWHLRRSCIAVESCLATMRPIPRSNFHAKRTAQVPIRADESLSGWNHASVDRYLSITTFLSVDVYTASSSFVIHNSDLRIAMTTSVNSFPLRALYNSLNQEHCVFTYLNCEILLWKLVLRALNLKPARGDRTPDLIDGILSLFCCLLLLVGTIKSPFEFKSLSFFFKKK